MANFVICVDPDDGRRRRFIDAAGPRLAMLPGLVTGTVASQEMEAAWAAGPRAPIGRCVDDAGAALVFGEVIDADGQRLTADGLRQRWQDPDAGGLRSAFDGYYAACVHQPGRRLLVGADRLGMFPVYYYQARGVLLVGSSPETFSGHPCFRAAFNPAGLVGILLTNGLVDGQTLLSGAVRLAPGQLLLWEPGTSAREVPSYEVPFTDRYLELSFANHLDIIDAAMTRTMARQAPSGRPYSLLLSGGLDSRTLGGYLKRAGRETTALTLGEPGDIEVRCALPVAKVLGMPQRTGELDTGRYADYARLHTTWEHCASGSSLLMEWGLVEHLAHVPPVCVTGLGLDWILGGHAPTVPDLSFASFFAYQNAWGLPPSALSTLLRRDVFGDLVPETMARIEATYRGYSDVEWRRAWRFSLHHRNRFHIGGEAWRISFGAWPILVATDAELLELGAGLPPATAADRRAQYDLLRSRFPDLAALPLDRNSHNMTPLAPQLRWLLEKQLRDPLSRVRKAAARRLGREGEPRRYYRIFDVNGPGWAAVREMAEPYRELGYEFFDRAALDELLPRPGVPVRAREGITDVAALKSVLGFLVWTHDHLRG